jgi:hypothetical protein
MGRRANTCGHRKGLFSMSAVEAVDAGRSVARGGAGPIEDQPPVCAQDGAGRSGASGWAAADDRCIDLYPTTAGLRALGLIPPGATAVCYPTASAAPRDDHRGGPGGQGGRAVGR